MSQKEATPEGKSSCTPYQFALESLATVVSTSHGRSPSTTGSRTVSSAYLDADLSSLTVLWAQRSSDTDAAKNFIYLTIAITDIDPKSMKLDIKPAKLTFSGYSDVKKQQYHVELELYEEIDVDNSQKSLTPRDLSLKLQKKDLKEEYWPRLLKTTQKAHFLKTDFDKVSCFRGMCVTCCDRVGKKLTSTLSHSGSTRMSKKVHQMRTWAVWEEAWEVSTSPN